jgi:hypothetical protein
MVVRALKHFVVVGGVFALAVGWVLTLAVNTALGNGIQALGGTAATDSYWFALLLTIVSLALIVAATAVGGRVFRTRVDQASLTRAERIASSALFLGVVLAFVVPELSDILGRFYSHMSYTYEHPAEAWMMLSLPLLRLFALPSAYFVLAGRAGRGTDPARGPMAQTEGAAVS